MRGGMAITWVLAFCLTGCGDHGDPAPTASDSSAAAPNGAVSPEAAGSAENAASTATVVLPIEAAPSPAAKTPAAALSVPIRLRALGTEPFWNARIDGKMLTYTTPEDQEGRRAFLVRRDHADGADFSGKLGGAAFHLAMTRRPCSDGMSDRTYPFAVVLTLGSARREGCAS